MSGSMFSTLGYLAAPNAANWEDMVASDPVYAWFIASETPMIGRKYQQTFGVGGFIEVKALNLSFVLQIVAMVSSRERVAWALPLML